MNPTKTAIRGLSRPISATITNTLEDQELFRDTEEVCKGRDLEERDSQSVENYSSLVQAEEPKVVNEPHAAQGDHDPSDNHVYINGGHGDRDINPSHEVHTAETAGEAYDFPNNIEVNIWYRKPLVPTRSGLPALRTTKRVGKSDPTVRSMMLIPPKSRMQSSLHALLNEIYADATEHQISSDDLKEFRRIASNIVAKDEEIELIVIESDTEEITLVPEEGLASGIESILPPYTKSVCDAQVSMQEKTPIQFECQEEITEKPLPLCELLENDERGNASALQQSEQNAHHLRHLRFRDRGLLLCVKAELKRDLRWSSMAAYQIWVFFWHFVAKIRETFELSGRFAVKYIDEDEDSVTIANETGMKERMYSAWENGFATIRVRIEMVHAQGRTSSSLWNVEELNL